MVWLLVTRLGAPAAITIYALVAIHNQNYGDLFFALSFMVLLIANVCSEFFQTQTRPT